MLQPRQERLENLEHPDTWSYGPPVLEGPSGTNSFANASVRGMIIVSEHSNSRMSTR
jgi:hypothetical protein